MDEVLHRFVHRLEEQGITLDDYFSVAGVDREQFVDDLRRQGERSVRTRLLLEAVAERSGLRVSDEELAAVVDGIAAQSDDPEAVRRALRDGAGEKSVVGDILRNRALGVILAGATPVDEDGNPVDLEIEALDEDGDDDGDDAGDEAVGLPGDTARHPVAAGIPVDDADPADVDAVVEAGVEPHVETAAEPAAGPAFEAVEEPPGTGAGGGTGVVSAGAEPGGSEEE
jgi:trigger factor